MKYKISLTFLLMVWAQGLWAQEIQWMTLNEALIAQKTEPKKILIDVYTVWCGPCKLLDRNTFGHPGVAAFINQHFYPVKFNAEGDSEVNYRFKKYRNPGYDPAKAKRRNSVHEFSRYLGVRAYPTVVFLDETGGLIKSIRGYRTPPQIELFLRFFGTDLWREIRTQEAYDQYVVNFKPSFQ